MDTIGIRCMITAVASGLLLIAFFAARSRSESDSNTEPVEITARPLIYEGSEEIKQFPDIDGLPRTDADRNIFGSWRYEDTVTLRVENTSLAKILEQIQEQTGIKIRPRFEERKELAGRKITIELEDASVWEAVAEISRISGLGFRTPPWARSGPSFEFSEEVEQLRDQQVLGPVLLGILEGQDDAPRTTEEVRIRIHWDGRYIQWLEHPRLVLVDTGSGHKAVSKRAERYMSLGESRDTVDCIYAVPEHMRGKSLEGTMSCVVLLAHDVAVAEAKLREGSYPNLGGVTVHIEKFDRKGDTTRLNYRITWDHQLSKDEVAKVHQLMERAWQGDYTRDDVAWLMSIGEREKLRRLVGREVVGADGQRIGISTELTRHGPTEIDGFLDLDTSDPKGTVRFDVSSRSYAVLEVHFDDLTRSE